MHNSYSPYAHTAYGARQGLILGALLFYVNICGIFFENVMLPATLMLIHLTYMIQIYTVLSKLKICTGSQSAQMF